jgi:hypothetical protein
MILNLVYFDLNYFFALFIFLHMCYLLIEGYKNRILRLILI